MIILLNEHRDAISSEYKLSHKSRTNFSFSVEFGELTSEKSGSEVAEIAEIEKCIRLHAIFGT